MGYSSRNLTLLTLIVAGESAFLLPFVLPRIFRPAILDVFGLTNLDLGIAFSVYGIVAMAAYFLGGPLADRFSPRKMLAMALMATAACGLVLLADPAFELMVALYAAWGVTTIALFWAPLIKATRDWGGTDTQGAAFGLLDGGRGLLAALAASVLVAVLGTILPADPDAATVDQRARALMLLITLLCAFTAAAALLVWFALPSQTSAGSDSDYRFSLKAILRVYRLPTVRLQALIILCAYVGFKATDDFSLYAHEVLGVDEVNAAAAGTLSLWIRPIAAVGAGFIADRFGSARMTLLSFVLLTAGSLMLASGLIQTGMTIPFLLTIVTASLGIFALRGLYYAIMKEGRVPLTFTGSAVGLVSLIGYTPDVFMGPLMGFLLDTSPGATGHQHVFMVVSGFAVMGIIASRMFSRSAEGMSFDTRT
ncbi:MAG: MFS transporter [Gammaproteobacteria bacterium]